MKLATQIEGQLTPSVDPGYTTKTAVSQGTYIYVAIVHSYVLHVCNYNYVNTFSCDTRLCTYQVVATLRTPWNCKEKPC